jgi:hypothetical protein
MPGISLEKIFLTCFSVNLSHNESSTTKIISEFDPVDPGSVCVFSKQEVKKTNKIIRRYNIS